MPVKNVADFGLAWLNSVRVGEEVEEDVEFRNSLNAGISTEIVETLQGHQKFFERTVLRLTSVNDATALTRVLEWATKNEIKLTWGDDTTDDDMDICESRIRKNPLMISAQQGYTKCTELLYRHGYRIPMLNVEHKTAQDCSKEEFDCQVQGTINKDIPEKTEAEKEAVRQMRITENPGDEDQVDKLLEFRAYTSPEYLSLMFTENVSSEAIENIKDGAVAKFQDFDPLRKALDMAKQAEGFGSEFQETTELGKHYAEIEEKLEDFACGFLTQCSTMDNVDTLLKHNPEDADDDVDDSEDQNWQKALQEGRKEFVNHPIYQRFFRKQLFGKYDHKHRTNSLRWNLVHVPFALAVFCTYPLIVLVDLFREANILFITAEAMNQREIKRTKRQDENYKNISEVVEAVSLKIDKPSEQKSNEIPFPSTENLIFRKYRIWIHTPVFRLISYHTIQLTYLVLLLIAVWNPNETPENATNHWYFYIIVVFIISLLVEDCVEFVRKKNYWDAESLWNPFFFYARLILVVGGGMSIHWHLFASKQIQTITEERANLSGNHQLNIGMTLVAIAITAEFYQILRFLLLDERLGPIVICVVKVFKDLYKVSIIFFVIFVAHAVPAWSMFKPFHVGSSNNTTRYQLAKENLKTKQGLFDGMLWRVLSPEGPDMVKVNDTTEGGRPYSMEFSHLMGIILWAVFQTIMVILLVNILIAIMNSTYMEVWESSNTEWKYSKTYYQAQFLMPRAVFPAPFRWIYYSAKFVYRFKLHRKAGKGIFQSALNMLKGPPPKTEQNQILKQKASYFKLLKKFIRVKQLSSEENTEENLNQSNIRLQMKVEELEKKNEELLERCSSFA